MISNPEHLLDMLSNNNVTFFIPPYQRNYEWGKDDCVVFMEDLIKTTKNNKDSIIDEHFFGTITYYQTPTAFGEPNKLILIDGQQRITTSMLFLIALRDVIDDENSKQIINERYLKNTHAANNTEYKIKLKQVETDWPSYKKIILQEDLTDAEKQATVYQNYQWFRTQLLEYKKEYDNLVDIISKGLSQFSIVKIELEPQKNHWENPQEIFESMNSIGKPLSLADLVRNYLMLGLDADTQEQYYKKYWLKIEATIPNNISDFIRDYMQGVKQMPVDKATEKNAKDLYRQFKEMFSDENSETLLKTLLDYAVNYSYIITNNIPNEWHLSSILKDINQLGITTAYSFLLMLLYDYSVNKNFSTREMEEILSAFRIYCLRRRLITTQGENKGFPLLVREIPKLQDSDDKQATMFEILSNREPNLRLPNDIELQRILETMDFYHFKHSTFYLTLIEEALTKNRPSLNGKLLQKEHIMPQRLSQDWKTMLGDNYNDIHQEYLNNIGNITLIRHNQELGNKSFKDKLEVYNNKSGLQIAKTKIIDCDEWTENEITRRQHEMIRILLNKVMRIPDQYRKANNYKMKDSTRLSFNELQLIGEYIAFSKDTTITAKVIGDKEVEFEGKKWKLSPLTRVLHQRMGIANKSGAYQGAQYWEFDGIKLADIM